VIGSRAAATRDWDAFPLLLYKAFRHGDPGLWQVAVYVAFWTVPIGIRRQLRAAFRGRAVSA